MARSPKPKQVEERPAADMAPSLFASETIEVPELGRNFTVRTLSARTFRRILDVCLHEGKSHEDDNAHDSEKLFDHIIAASLVDEKGERVVPVGQEEEVADLLPTTLYTKVGAITRRLNLPQDDDAGN